MERSQTGRNAHSRNLAALDHQGQPGEKKCWKYDADGTQRMGGRGAQQKRRQEFKGKSESFATGTAHTKKK